MSSSTVAAAAPMVSYRKPPYLYEAANPVSFALSLIGRTVDDLRVPQVTEIMRRCMS